MHFLTIERKLLHPESESHLRGSFLDLVYPARAGGHGLRLNAATNCYCNQLSYDH